jgi:inorganic pyrophosphatase
VFSPGVTNADEDPLDVCVISERPITRSEIVVSGRVLGGIQMVDDGEADDKIVAVLDNDPFWEAAEDLEALPKRIRHYFSTYKLLPGSASKLTVSSVYDRDHAQKVIEASMNDYIEAYGEAPPTLRF